MSVQTSYDDIRDRLRDDLTECLKLAAELVTSETWGHDDMRSDYAIDIYQAVKKARDMV